MHIASMLHVGQNVLLQLRYALKRIGHILILLDIADDLRSLCALSEIDEVGLLDDGRDAVLNESKIGQVNTYGRWSVLTSVTAKVCGKLTEKRDTRGIGLVQCLPVLEEVFGASHKCPHTLEDCTGLLVHLVPCPRQSMDRRRSKSGDDRRQRREVV